MLIIERIAGIILPVFIIVLLGYAFARLRAGDGASDMAAVNRISIEVLCPLLVFTALAAKEFSLFENATLIIAGVLIALGSGVIAWPIAKYFGYDPRSFVPPMMYNNCGNMGLPLAVLAFGDAGLSEAVALFMACNLIYFTVGISILERGRATHGKDRYRFLFSPMMLAMFAGVASSLAGIVWPEPLFAALKMLGTACIPLMLFALGVRMRDVRFESWRIGVAGAIVCPVAGIVIALALDLFLTLDPRQRGQMFLFAALPPAVFCFMVAEQYRQEPDKVASIVLLGNLAAVLFVPAGLWLGLRP